MSELESIKCSLCEESAITIINYAKLRLCKRHFIDFIQKRVLNTIKRYDLIKDNWKVLVAISGGKDSAVMLHILSNLSKQLNFKIIALHINLGIGKYSENANYNAEKICNDLSIPLILLDIKNIIGMSLLEIKRKNKRPICSICGLLKRYFINATAIETKANVVAIGHHMDDLLSYIIKNFILQNIYEISKLGPKTETKELFIGRIRPLYEISEKETSLYAFIQNLPRVEESCPYVKEGSMEFEIKRFLNNMEIKNPNIKIAFARALAKNINFYKKEEEEIRKCIKCGMPTSRDICAFCRLIEKTMDKSINVRDGLKEIIEKLKVV
jgi:uncharacterized protein (TIGR00269 family)